MYRDKDAQLRRLERELLRQEQNAPEQPEFEESPDGEEPLVYRNFANGYSVRGNQAADVDMEAYSDEVYREPGSNRPLVITALALLCGILGVLCWWAWRYMGVLG